MPKVSVIIATYKAEPYIERCARSLFGQTLGDMEFIFVDDCSPDHSIAVMQRVLEEFPERKAQVRVLRHETNRGVSQTRQDGLDAATGDYVIHCDPDDWVDPDMYQTLHAAALAHQADLVLCRAHNDSSNIPDDFCFTSETLLEAMMHISPLKGLNNAPWNKLIKREIAQSAKFPVGVSCGEDANFIIQILKKPLKITYVPRQFYHYEDNPGGITKQITRSEIDSGYRNVLQVNGMMTGNPRFDNCLKSYICAIMFKAYVSNVLTRREYLERYLPYKDYIRVLPPKSLTIKVLLWLSFHGCYNLGLFLDKLRKKIRR